jgi:hypothetical protein
VGNRAGDDDDVLHYFSDGIESSATRRPNCSGCNGATEPVLFLPVAAPIARRGLKIGHLRRPMDGSRRCVHPHLFL